MTNPPFVTAIIGFGKVSSGYADDPAMAHHYRYTTHAQVLRAHPGFDWRAVVDPATSACDTAVRQWGIAQTAPDVSALPNRADIDVAILAMPPGPGRLAAINALPGLKGVIVEKPLGRSLAEAQDFLRTCDARNIKVQVNLWRRADQTFRALAAGELKNRIGRVQTGLATYGNGLHNNGVHVVDMLRMFVGEINSVQAISAPTTNPHWPLPGDIQVAAALRFDFGAMITLAPLEFASYREVGLDLWGVDGRLSILQEGLLIQSFPRAANRAMTGEYEIASDQPASISSTVGEAFFHMYDNLAMALLGKAALCSPAPSALISEAVVEAIVRSANTGTRQTPMASNVG
jgi:predicted dehydrogenase